MDGELVAGIRERTARVRDRISAAARASGRDPDTVELVVVTKTQPVEVVRAAVQAGLKTFGENYAEEALEKIRAIGAGDVDWHMIGHVQSRKAGSVAEHFAMLHSLDGARLAARLDRFASAAGRRLPVLLECNVSGEESKFGLPAWDDSHWPALCVQVEQILALPGLQVRGLMTMPPYAPDPEASRPHFRRLAGLRDRFAQAYPRAGWGGLSMGTSLDFAVAVAEGATFVRIGTAILGPRSG